MAKKNRPKKSKALVVWAIVTVIAVSYTHLTLPTKA